MTVKKEEEKKLKKKKISDQVLRFLDGDELFLVSCFLQHIHTCQAYRDAEGSDLFFSFSFPCEVFPQDLCAKGFSTCIFIFLFMFYFLSYESHLPTVFYRRALSSADYGLPAFDVLDDGGMELVAIDAIDEMYTYARRRLCGEWMAAAARFMSCQNPLMGFCRSPRAGP